jgi:hypothetical protein
MNMFNKIRFVCFSVMILTGINVPVSAQITRIWLSHRTNTPSHVVVNWESSSPGHSEVCFYVDSGKSYRVIREEYVNLHHLEIHLEYKDDKYHYYVKTGDEQSDTYTFNSYPSVANELRIAFVGNWGYSRNPDLSQLIKDAPHLLVSLGDNIPNLYRACGEGVTDCIEPFLRRIDAAPELFRSTFFLTVAGNHDKEIRPRGKQPPAEAVYDTNATAFCKFFELPDDEWKWKFGIPDFDIHLVGLDLNHLYDFGTTWQTAHDFRIGSEQFNWYKTVMETRPKGYVITVNNEKNEYTRQLEHGFWQELFEKGNAVITGFGYYAEYAEVNGFPYFNTSLGAGTTYPDTHSKFLQQAGNYLLLRRTKNELPLVEIKLLDGTVVKNRILYPKNLSTID